MTVGETRVMYVWTLSVLRAGRSLASLSPIDEKCSFRISALVHTWFWNFAFVTRRVVLTALDFALVARRVVYHPLETHVLFFLSLQSSFSFIIVRVMF